MKIPQVFLTDSKDNLEKLLKKKAKKKEVIDDPRLGDGVYVPVSPYKDRPREDCLVGWGKIGGIKKTNVMGEKKYLISLEGRECVWYDWDSIQKHQEAWGTAYESIKRKHLKK